MIRIFLFLISINILNIGVAQNTASNDNTAPLVRGCYLSVDEYLTNSPSFVDSFYLTFEPRLQENWEGTLSRTPRYGGKNKKIKDIWGFSDGYNAYVFHQNEYFKLENDSNGIYFFGYEIYDKSPSPMLGVSGNGIGLGIAIPMNSKRAQVRYTIHETYGYIVHPNPKSKRIVPVSIPQEDVVFYRLSKKELEVSFDFMVNDSLVFSFGPNSYAEVGFPDETTEITISFGDDFSIRKSFTLNEKEIDYFKFSVSEKVGGMQEIEQVSDSEGEFYSDSALKAQQKRERK